jgi:hypothetical protein
MPGENPETLPAPAALVPSLLRLVSPDLTATGKIFDYRQERLLDVRSPA